MVLINFLLFLLPDLMDELFDLQGSGSFKLFFSFAGCRVRFMVQDCFTGVLESVSVSKRVFLYIAMRFAAEVEEILPEDLLPLGWL